MRRLLWLCTIGFFLACGGLGGAPPPWLIEALDAADDGGEIDPCDPRSWAFEALAALNDGMSEDPAAVDEVLATEPLLAPLAAHPLGERWRESWRADLDTDVGIGLFLAANPEYTREFPDFPPTSLRFDPDGTAEIRMLGRPEAQEGSWTLEGGTIEVDLGDTSMRLRPRRAPYYLVLESDAATWAVDPVVCAG